VNLPEDLLLSGNAVFLLLDKPLLDGFDLRPDRVQVVVVVLYAIRALLVKHGLELVPR